MSVEAVAADIATRRRIGVTLALVALVVLLVLISLGIGPVRLSPLTVIEALFGGGSDVSQVIVREIRLPRMILALAIGAILGLSGAALQGLLRNPLASPSLFGAPQSAAFGAVLVIALGLADVRSYALPVVAIIAAFGSVFVLLAIAGRNAGLLILILAGLAISSSRGRRDRAGDEPRQQSLSWCWKSRSGCSARWRTAVFSTSCWRCRSSWRAGSSCSASAAPFARSASARRPRRASASMSPACGSWSSRASRSASAARSRSPAPSASSGWSRRI